MKNISSPLTLAAFVLIASPVNAAEKPLNTAQIEELLVGKSSVGVHFGVQARQYFSKSGLTL